MAVLTAFTALWSGCEGERESQPPEGETTSSSSVPPGSPASSSPSSAPLSGSSRPPESEGESALPPEESSVTSSLPPSEASSLPPSPTPEAGSESSGPEPSEPFSESGSASEEYFVITADDVADPEDFSGDIEREIIDLVNEEREANGLEPLAFSETLRTAARVRSKELLLNDHFAHTRPDGSPWQTVFEDAVPMSYHMAGENLATITMERGYKAFTARDWMQLWLDSPTHYDNIVRPEFTHIGVAVYFEWRDDTYIAYATQLFAAY